MSDKPVSVDDYLEGLGEQHRAILSKLRQVIRAAVPDAAESISYGLPAYKYRSRPLVYFGVAKNHYALYGLGGAGHEEELAPFDTSGKGTIRFTAEQPLPDELVTAMLRDRVADIEAAAAPARSRAKG